MDFSLLQFNLKDVKTFRSTASRQRVAPPKPISFWLTSVCILPGLVRDPFFVDVFVQPGQHPHHLPASCAHHDVTAHSIQHINRLGFPAKTAEDEAKENYDRIRHKNEHAN